MFELPVMFVHTSDQLTRGKKKKVTFHLHRTLKKIVSVHASMLQSAGVSELELREVQS